MLPIKEAVKHYTSPAICEYYFNKYLHTRIHEGTISTQDRKYDHLGMIDTLGWDLDNGCNHFSYRDEMTSMYGIKISSKWFVCVNCDKPEVYVFIKKPLTHYLT